jgi:hypothetical protein
MGSNSEATANRITIANLVLKSFAPETSISKVNGYLTVHWNGNSKRWMTRGQDFYPVWKNKWGHGGTACVALSQLIRWCQGVPVLGLGVWKYWASQTCKLVKDEAVLGLLDQAGYPIKTTCVLCQQPTDGRNDWWNLNGVSGPCCSIHSGCQQKGHKVQHGK